MSVDAPQLGTVQVERVGDARGWDLSGGTAWSAGGETELMPAVGVSPEALFGLRVVRLNCVGEWAMMRCLRVERLNWVGEWVIMSCFRCAL